MLRHTMLVVAALLAVAAMVAILLIAPAHVALMDFQAAAGDPDRLKHLADTRTAMLQLIGGVAAAVTVYFTWRNLVRTSQESARAAADALQARRDATDARIADSFVKATELLGQESQSVRAAGALALGRLLRAVSDETDYWVIMDVLTAFVRHRTSIETATKGKTRPDQDVETALNVIARRTIGWTPERREDSPADLSGCDLTGAWLDGAKLSGAYFGGSVLRNVVFDRADLSGADFDRAVIDGATFTGARLDGVDLSRAQPLGTQEPDAGSPRTGSGEASGPAEVTVALPAGGSGRSAEATGARDSTPHLGAEPASGSALT